MYRGLDVFRTNCLDRDDQRMDFPVPVDDKVRTTLSQLELKIDGTHH